MLCQEDYTSHCHVVHYRFYLYQLQNDNLIVPLGTSQGLKNGKVGFVSNSNSNISMQDWVVVTVKQSGKDFSILEILNPTNKKEDINGRIIRFIN